MPIIYANFKLLLFIFEILMYYFQKYFYKIFLSSYFYFMPFSKESLYFKENCLKVNLSNQDEIKFINPENSNILKKIDKEDKPFSNKKNIIPLPNQMVNKMKYNKTATKEKRKLKLAENMTQFQPEKELNNCINNSQVEKLSKDDKLIVIFPLEYLFFFEEFE